ncbi:MAG: DEAD/DEAH box helicase family protein, partial [Elusimicrobiota bacterium]
MHSNNDNNSNDKSQKEIEEILAESTRLKEENARLKKLLGLVSDAGQNSQNKYSYTRISEPRPCVQERGEPNPCVYERGELRDDLSNNKKIQIFRSLFRGREDVYAVRWIGKNGKTGYSPACANEWSKELCNKLKVKCAECPNREYLPVTDTVIYNHLTGKQTVGIYPLLQDETCCFLAVDFDKVTWKNDAEIFLSICKEIDIPAVMERSRSGNGAHIWIFFEENIPAVLARKLGTLVLTKAIEKRYQIGFDSYDRFFPNQDTMPKGGFGNLIALPLQRIPREKGNSVFINLDFKPYENQWEFLTSIKKMSFEQVDSLLKIETRSSPLIGIRTVADTDSAEDPWTLPPSRKVKEDKVSIPLPESIRIVQSNLVYIEKKDLPSIAIKHILGFAAFQNPEFYKTQRMRLSTFGKPRIIYCGEDFPEYIGLPRGCIDEILDFFERHNTKVKLEDKRFEGNPINLEFHGELRPEQKKSANVLLETDIGVLSAGTAFGKTVVGAYIISARKVNTLVLVHRRQLVEQWIKNLSMFLNIPEKSIGQIGSGKNTLTGIVDVGIIQSLFRKGTVKDFIANYGHIVVDECHHVSSFSFEQVLRQAKAKYILGLTATPVRKDGHHPIIVMQ